MDKKIQEYDEIIHFTRLCDRLRLYLRFALYTKDKAKIITLNKGRIQEVNQLRLRIFISPVYIKGLPVCLDPDPDSRLTINC